MTERLRSGGHANSNISAKMANDLTPRKTMIILVIVAGCFAVLWPKVFYPMLVGSANQHMKPSPIDKTTGCCDVISEIDFNTIKIMSELCRSIIKRDEDTPLTGREIVAKCQHAVLETCGIDISAVLQEQVKLGQTVKQILDEVRSLNGSLCLKYNFGVSPWRLGVPHRVTVMPPSSSIRQERPLHLGSEMVHPAFRERGRAIPQPNPRPAISARPPPRIVEGRPGPIPAMRPTLGGAGHVVPPPKQNAGSMGLIMPIYTIGIVIFFTYTVMKIVFKKQPEALYPPVQPDPHFRREVFESNRGHGGQKLTRESVSSKLVVNAMSALLDEVDQEIESRRKTSEVADQDVVANGNVVNSYEDDQPSVKVLGMETTASCEGGKKWSRPVSPVLPQSPPHAPEPAEPPQEIFLEGALPAQSHLLVADSATEAQQTSSEEDPAVVLAGKMTLSVISLDSSENGTDESSNSGKKQDERSSSNISEEFEKIEIDSQIEDQIDNIIEEAQLITQKQEEPNLLEELENELKKIEGENIITELGRFEQPDLLNIEEPIISDAINKLDDIAKEFLVKEIAESGKQEIEPEIIDKNGIHLEAEEKSIGLQIKEDKLVGSEISEQLDEKIGQEQFKASGNAASDEDVVIEQEAEKNFVEALDTEKNSIEREIKNLNEATDREKNKEISKENEQGPEAIKNISEALDADRKEVVKKQISESEPLFDLDPLESVIASLTSEKVDEPVEKEIIKAESIPEAKLVEKVETEEPVVQITEIRKAIEPELGGSDGSIKEQTQIFTEKEIANEEDSRKVKSSDADSKIEPIEERPLEVAEDIAFKKEASEETSPQAGISASEKETFDKLNEAIADLSSEFKLADVEEKDRGEPVDVSEDEEEEEIEYEYEDSDNEEAVNEEIRNLDRGNGLGDRLVDHVNGDDPEQSKYATTSSATLAENEISDEENLQDEDEEEEIEEIIEYITDDEEEPEEVVQLANRNNVNHVNERSGAHQ